MPGPIVAQRCVGQSRWPPFICRLIRLNFILFGLRACAGPYLTESLRRGGVRDRVERCVASLSQCPRPVGAFDLAGGYKHLRTAGITSLRHWKDQTLILQPGDHSFIVQQSVIAYENACLLREWQVERVLKEGIAQPPASTELLLRITDGLTKSPFTPNKVKAFYQKYF